MKSSSNLKTSPKRVWVSSRKSYLLNPEGGIAAVEVRWKPGAKRPAANNEQCEVPTKKTA